MGRGCPASERTTSLKSWSLVSSQGNQKQVGGRHLKVQNGHKFRESKQARHDCEYQRRHRDQRGNHGEPTEHGWLWKLIWHKVDNGPCARSASSPTLPRTQQSNASKFSFFSLSSISFLPSPYLQPNIPQRSPPSICTSTASIASWRSFSSSSTTAWTWRCSYCKKKRGGDLHPCRHVISTTCGAHMVSYISTLPIQPTRPNPTSTHTKFGGFLGDKIYMQLQRAWKSVRTHPLSKNIKFRFCQFRLYVQLQRAWKSASTHLLSRNISRNTRRNSVITFKIDMHSPKVSTTTQSVLVNSPKVKAQLHNLC